jgi:hypothetical protein
MAGLFICCVLSAVERAVLKSVRFFIRLVPVVGSKQFVKRVWGFVCCAAILVRHVVGTAVIVGISVVRDACTVVVPVIG